MELSKEAIKRELAPFLARVPAGAIVNEALYERLRVYLELLQRWNARTNLTAIRERGEMVRRHFGESLFAGCLLGEVVRPEAEMLDVGTGAGFPGVPVQLLLPSVRVVLAESQGKKVAFLREVVRTLDLKCEVHAGRVEGMAAGRQFDAVMMRAVDRMGSMVEVAKARVRDGGWLLEMTGEGDDLGLGAAIPGRNGSFVRLRRCG